CNKINELNLDKFENKIRYFGGIPFNKKNRSKQWEQLSCTQFVLPRFEVTKSETGNEFICNLKFPDDLDKINTIEEELDSLQFDNIYNDFTIPKILNRTDNPDQDGWQINVKKILDLIETGRIEKLVTARESTVKFSENLDSVFILRSLKKSTPGCFHFCFQPEKDYAFIGASPERLYHRNKNQIITEALAGTRVRGKTSDEDNRLGNELLNSEKDIREQSFVSKSIKNNLDRLCSKLRVDKETTLMKLARVQHLMTGIEGKLKEGITDQDILGNLHPTPAVGGYPQEKAVDLISEIEPFDRGWYTGPIGWISKDKADFAVAIRSGLIVKNKLHIYAGAGIVKGSDPDNEWNEIESKIATFMKVLS
ncbi:MAG: isochorismate synthase, partial [bacterium]